LPGFDRIDAATSHGIANPLAECEQALRFMRVIEHVADERTNGAGNGPMPFQKVNVPTMIQARRIALDNRTASKIPEEQPGRKIDYGSVNAHQIATASSLALTCVCSPSLNPKA